MTDENLKTAVLEQRKELADKLGRDMLKLAKVCGKVIDDPSAIETVLTRTLRDMPECKHLFVLDASGRQFVKNITHDGPDPDHLGRDRSARPYVQGLAGNTDFQLSKAYYISRNKKTPMLTAVQVIRDGDGMCVGYVGADHDLRQLSATKELYREARYWQQIKGDPAIRGGLFAQQRSQSVMDDHLDDILALINELMTERGIFHCKLHFSSNRAIIWLIDEPFIYRLLDIEELTDTDICLAHPRRVYADRAVVPRDKIGPVFRVFRDLRFADETIYLRSGSLNLFNGLVSLNFSCDGTHYLPYGELLERGLNFWVGSNPQFVT